jgi:adenine C2-methylase RlmN of 23S rRNA A2503 and tRNA A37
MKSVKLSTVEMGEMEKSMALNREANPNNITGQSELLEHAVPNQDHAKRSEIYKDGMTENLHSTMPMHDVVNHRKKK